MTIRHIIPAAAAALVLTASCDRQPRFEIRGEVNGAEGRTLVLSKADFAGRWITLDSVRVDGDGRFSLKSPAPAAPEIYRLSLGDRFLYFPVDSVETISLESAADSFGDRFSLSGSPQAERLAAFEKELASYNPADSAAADAFKRNVYARYIQDSRGSILSYYALTKVIDGKPLFDPADRNDCKYYGAVATQFEQFRPDDPHGRMVREAAVAAMRRRNSDRGRRRVYEASEVSMLEIALPDENGATRNLSESVGHGKPVLLVFSLMNRQESPAFNRSLADIAAGRPDLTIYQVSLDRDQYAWRDAARNLPWITVFDAGGMTSTAVRDYNVQSLPAFYLYDASGSLKESAGTFDELHKKLSSI